MAVKLLQITSGTSAGIPDSVGSKPWFVVLVVELIPFPAAYTEDLGAVGGACLEDETNSLRLDEDSEHPPMILRTD